MIDDNKVARRREVDPTGSCGVGDTPCQSVGVISPRFGRSWSNKKLQLLISSVFVLAIIALALSRRDLLTNGYERQGRPILRAGNQGSLYSEEVVPKDFPPGCHWACYIDLYPDLIQQLERTKDAALQHYITHGAKKGRDCHCNVEKKVKQFEENMPEFQQAPSLDSACHNMDTFAGYCKNIACMKHGADVDDKLLQSSLGVNYTSGAENFTSVGGCKMLWFTAMHESDGNSRSSLEKYASYYSAALNSALLNARDSLEPYLLLGRYGTMAENSTEHKELGRWAEAWGVKVFYSPRLSLHDHALFREWTEATWTKEAYGFNQMQVCLIILSCFFALFLQYSVINIIFICALKFYQRVPFSDWTFLNWYLKTTYSDHQGFVRIIFCIQMLM